MTQRSTPVTAAKDVDAMIRQTRLEIQRAPICEPGPGEFVDECHWSQTGFAIWKASTKHSGNYCTCRPARAPFGGTS